MVFILYKLYFLSPYTKPIPKLTPYRNFVHFYIFKKTKQTQKHLVCFLSLLNYGDLGSVLKNLHILIPLSYPCQICVPINHPNQCTHVGFHVLWAHSIDARFIMYIQACYLIGTNKKCPHKVKIYWYYYNLWGHKHWEYQDHTHKHIIF